MFKFGDATLRVGQQVKYTNAGRTITGVVASLPSGGGSWIKIQTAYKTCPIRDVSVRCNVQAVAA